MPQYTIRRVDALPPLDAPFDSDSWEAADILEIRNFHERSSDHRPHTRVRALYDESGIAMLFEVRDRYVRSVTSEYMGGVCTDSCVEFFVWPHGANGYFNFEINCGGTLHTSFIEDWERKPEGGFKRWTPLPPAIGQQVRIFHTLPPVVDPEISEPVEWRIGMMIPYAVIGEYMDLSIPPAGQTWKGNFYKCGDKTSHPHWATWAPVQELNFHQPECFASIRFAE